nr:reverse transcriptase domain-containing protein [Tanacetum cinerariifolium]
MFYEAWDRFNDLLRACPHHGFSELHQLDTFYNALNVNDQDSLNSAAGGNFLDKMPQECLKIIESKSKVHQSRAKAVVAKVSMSSSTPSISSEVAELKDLVRALLLDKKNQSSAPSQSSTPAPVKAVKPNCVTCGGSNFNQGQLHRPHVNQPRAYQAPIPQTQSASTTDFESYVKANDAVLRNMQNQGQNLQIKMANLMDMLSKFVSSNTASSSGSGTLPSNTITNHKEDLKGITTRSDVAYQGPIISTPVLMPNLKPSIPYPSRRDNERRRDHANKKIEKFYEILKDMSFEISFTDALILMPKFASTLKALIGNKERLSEMARTPINEHCLAVILNKFPRKLGNPGKFLIPCKFPGMDECLALADLGASINLMPLSVWEGLSLPELTSTCMTLELTYRSVSKPIGIAKDVSVKTGRALIDVHKGKLTLHIRNEAITYNLDQTVRYSANYNQMTANKIDVICEEYSQEVLGFFDVTASGKPTLYDDLIVSTTSSTLTSFGDSDFLLFEEADAFLGLEDDPNSPKINPFYYDPKGDILLLEAILNSEPLPPLSNHEQYMPSFKKELKVCEAKTVNLPLMNLLRLNLRTYLPISKVEKLLDAGLIYPISDSPWVSPVHCMPTKGGFTVVENEENELIPTRLVTKWRVCIDFRKLNEATHKDHFPLPFMDQMLERLAGNEFYCFHDGFSGYFQIPIDPRDQETTTFTCPYGTFAYRRMPFGLCNAPDTNLCLNWEKSHFMVKEGIVLGHKISKNGIEVDKAKVDVIAKLPHPTTVKGAVLGQHHEKHFKPIHYASKTMTDAEFNYTTTEKEMLAVVYAFKKFRSYLIMNKSIVYTDHSALKYLFAKKDAKARLLQWVLLLQEFDFKVLDIKGAENLAADHLS